MRQYYKKGSFPDLNKDGKITQLISLWVEVSLVRRKKKKKIKPF